MLKRLNCLFARDCGEGLIVTAVLFEIGLVNDVGKVEAIRLKFILKCIRIRQRRLDFTMLAR